MRLEVMQASRSAKKFLARLAVCGSVGVLVLAVSPLVGTRTAAAAVTVSPASLNLKAKVGNITYGMVTITNTGSTSDTLMSAAGDPRPPFWPTWGGTCNVQYLYILPPGRSCTFQFGFKPRQKGHVSGQGTVTFQSGATLTIQLNGVGQ